jgi:ribonuclease HI
MIIFTDGGCINNGKKNAKAAFAVYMNNIIIRGYVIPNEYILQCNNNISLKCNDIFIPPSNNRGELLAIIYAFIEIITNNTINEEITLYSDSIICVKTINEWYTNRLNNGTLNRFKNLDLINIMMNLYDIIKKNNNISIVHIRGHQKVTKVNNNEEIKLINGNNIVDLYVSDLLKNIDYSINIEHIIL